MVRRLVGIIGSDEALLGAVVFLAGFALLLDTGLIGTGDGGALRALHAAPALAVTILLAVIVACRLAVMVRSGGEEGVPRVLGAAVHVGILLVAAGIVVSSLIRFEARLVLTEGQQASLSGEDYVPGSVYSGRYGTAPAGRISMMQVRPLLSGKGGKAWDLTARVAYESGVPGKTPAARLHSLFPLPLGGAFYRVLGIGYSPLVRISDPSGLVIGEGYFTMRLFPPGSEDALRLPFLPYTVYLKYYPDGTTPDGSPGARFGLRAVRNIDLIVPSRLVVQGERISLDLSANFSIHDVRPWAEIRIVKDHGYWLIAPGAVLACAAALWGKSRGIALTRILGMNCRRSSHAV